MPHTLLIATVGGSPVPVAASLKHLRPDRVLFVVSPETRKLIADIRNLAALDPHPFRLDEGQYEIESVPDAQDFNGCVRAMRGLHESAVRWRERGDDFAVVLDFTGGTKCMSAALALVGGGWGCQFSYVGGTERTKNSVGIVVDGKEQVLHAQDPWLALGIAGQEDAIRLFDAGNFAAASRILEAAVPQVLDDVRRRELSALRTLADGYDAWDRFEHRQARSQLDKTRRAENDLRSILGRDRADSLLSRVAGNLTLLERLTGGNRLSAGVIADLIANAQRRGNEGRFDDAVARLYRAVEAIAQVRLRDTHGIADTAAVPHAQLPDPMRTTWSPRPDGTIALGVQGAFELLTVLGDPLAAIFRERGLHDRQKSNLTARNQSILAHGFSPIGEHVYSELRADLEHLAAAAGITADLYPVFPRLGT